MSSEKIVCRLVRRPDERPVLHLRYGLLFLVLLVGSFEVSEPVATLLLLLQECLDRSGIVLDGSDLWLEDLAFPLSHLFPVDIGKELMLLYLLSVTSGPKTFVRVSV